MKDEAALKAAAEAADCQHFAVQDGWASMRHPKLRYLRINLKDGLVSGDSDFLHYGDGLKEFNTLYRRELDRQMVDNLQETANLNGVAMQVMQLEGGGYEVVLTH